MTCPRVDRDLLILFVSLSLSPTEPDCVSRSEPARSTRFSVPAVVNTLTHNMGHSQGIE